MPILIDDFAWAEAQRRRTHGRDATITLALARIPHGGSALSARWGQPYGPERCWVRQRVGGVRDVTLCVEERIARYARWSDVTLSGWRMGPFGHLTVVREPLVLREMLRWERSRG